jgi:hypothetical protein
VEIRRQNIKFCYGNNGATQFYFWEYINRNQRVVLDSHQTFICSADTDSDPVAGFLVLYWGDEADYGVWWSNQPAKLHRLAGRYDNLTP